METRSLSPASTSRERHGVPSVTVDAYSTISSTPRAHLLQREHRLTALAERLDRTLAHQLVGLAPLAWEGDESQQAIDRLRVCLLELKIAAAGLRHAAMRRSRDDHPVRSEGAVR